MHLPRSTGLVSVLVAALSVGAGCGGDSAPSLASLDEGCSINSDCNTPLVCAFSRCHDACTSSRDCPDKELCVPSDRPDSVCQLSSESACTTNAGCPVSEVCAVDDKCRAGCATDRDCIAGQVCRRDTCADTTELTNDDLTPKDLDGGAPPVGQPCSYDSQCAPFLCKSGACVPECTTDRDCAAGTCVANVCMTKGNGGAAGMSGAGANAGSAGKSGAPQGGQGGVAGTAGSAGNAQAGGAAATGGAAGNPQAAGGASGGPSAGTGGASGVGAGGSGGTSGTGGASGTAGMSAGVGGMTVGGSAGVGGEAGSGGGAGVGGMSGASGAAGSSSCVAATCTSLKKNCGLLDDGCGSVAYCGACDAGQTCGASGTPNQCAPGTCAPGSCASLGAQCGSISDGCGWLLSCGGCPTGQTCGGAGVPNECGCAPDPNVCTGKCGDVSDGCGKKVTCDACPNGGVCGGGGTPNVCGSGMCTAKSCQDQGLDCGAASDGCEAVLDCGTCSLPESCGGSGKSNVCGCTPMVTCTTLGKDCGTILDDCGNLVQCGSCIAPETCGGSGVANSCGQPTSTTPTSCLGGGIGAGPSCGYKSDDCCATESIAGGTYQRQDEPTLPAMLSPYHLDRYEVTVGRMRAFVTAGAGTQANPPLTGSGVNPFVPGSGWTDEMTKTLPVDTAGLRAELNGGGGQTWTDAPSSNDTAAANFLTWQLAFAFCVWDGGRLPTEWEWEFAAAGGPLERQYPWAAPQSLDASYANFFYSLHAQPIAVGLFSPMYDGAFGNADLLGNVAEWTLDMFEPTYAFDATCVDCAYVGPGVQRVFRGGSYSDFSSTSFARSSTTSAPAGTLGVRCAR